MVAMTFDTYEAVKRLQAKGFTDADIARVEAVLPQVFELSYAFSPLMLGEETMHRIGVPEENVHDAAFDVLRSLGFSKEQIDEANTVICGRMTIEGAPHLKPEHLPIFDCANRCGKIGKRFIGADGHIRMMAAAQPFISGAISKTINLPKEAMVEDIKQAYFLGWKLGLKANALYRDGSKLSQALSTSADTEKRERGEEPRVVIKERVVLKEVPRRRKLPSERMAIAHKFSIGGLDGYIHVGMYEDGSPGEIFITMSKDGSTLSGVMDTLALSLSLNLQYGVPLEVICEKLIHKRFEPMGMTTNAEIPLAKSIMDYIARWLALKFLPKDQAKKFHNAELVERAYGDGTKSRDAFAMHLPIVDEGAAIPRRILVEEELEGGIADRRIQAKIQGFTGSMCTACGSTRMRRNGSCELCGDCGATSGCS